MMNVHLKYPPLKYPLKNQKLPDKLIYRTIYDYAGYSVDKFIMFSTKKGENKIARMSCFPEYITRDGRENVPSLYVWKLFAPGGGFGTEMLDFARAYSRNLGCGGNIHLSANGCYNPYRLPHIFYRKYGMSTENSYINKRLDDFIKKGKLATYLDFDTVDMYYPPIKFKENKIKRMISHGLKSLLGFKS